MYTAHQSPADLSNSTDMSHNKAPLFPLASPASLSEVHSGGKSFWNMAVIKREEL